MVKMIEVELAVGFPNRNWGLCTVQIQYDQDRDADWMDDGFVDESKIFERAEEIFYADHRLLLEMNGGVVSFLVLYHYDINDFLSEIEE